MIYVSLLHILQWPKVWTLSPRDAAGWGAAEGNICRYLKWRNPYLYLSRMDKVQYIHFRYHWNLWWFLVLSILLQKISKYEMKWYVVLATISPSLPCKRVERPWISTLNFLGIIAGCEMMCCFKISLWNTSDFNFPTVFFCVPSRRQYRL